MKPPLCAATWTLRLSPTNGPWNWIQSSTTLLLYAGDSEFKKAYASKDPQFRKEHFEQAGIWFAKAIAINPNRETAYRYWGDALKLEGKTDEARDKFVDAIVAEPYSRKAYVGLTQWADRHKISMAHPKIVVPSNVSSG